MINDKYLKKDSFLYLVTHITKKYPSTLRTMRQITVSLFILLAIYLSQPIYTLATPYETQVVFYHEQAFPKDYYWIVMQIEKSGRMLQGDDKTRSGLRQLAREISVLKEIVDEYNNANRLQQNESSTATNNKTIYPTQDEELTLIINTNNDHHQTQNTEAFSTKLTNLQSQLNHFHLTLSSLDIHLNNPYSIRQEVYLRVPVQKRQQLGELVDDIQEEFGGSSEGLRVLAVEMGNRNSYAMVGVEGNQSRLYQKNVQQLINQQELIGSIKQQAENYCRSINMELSEIKSFHPLMDQEAPHTNQTQQEKSQSPAEQTQQMTYDQAYDIVSNMEFNDYENVFYQVKAICKGDQRPKRAYVEQKKSDKTKISKKKDSRNKSSKKDKIQREINKLNNILQNQSNN